MRQDKEMWYCCEGWVMKVIVVWIGFEKMGDKLRGKLRFIVIGNEGIGKKVV